SAWLAPQSGCRGSEAAILRCDCPSCKSRSAFSSRPRFGKAIGLERGCAREGPGRESADEHVKEGEAEAVSPQLARADSSICPASRAAAVPAKGRARSLSTALAPLRCPFCWKSRPQGSRCGGVACR